MQQITVEQLQQAVEEQTRLVAAADHALRRAETAVAHARTLAAADHAHRQADAALIAVEEAEFDLTNLQRKLAVTPPTAPASTRRATARRRPAQAALFDVG